MNSGTPEPVYFFHGTEEHRIKDAVSLVKSAIMKGADPSTAWRVFNLAETSFGEVLGDLKTVSFFSERRGVMIEGFLKKGGRGDAGRESNDDGDAEEKDAKKIRLDEKEQEAFFGYLANPSPDIVLIITCGKADKRLKFWKEIEARSFSVEFESKPEHRKIIIAERLKTSGLQFAPEAREWMIERFVDRLAFLESELKKLALYLGDVKKVSLPDLEASMSAPPIDSVFKLAESIAAGNMHNSLEALNSLRRQGEILLIVQGMIAWQFRVLLTFKSGKEQRLSEGEIAKKCGIPPFYYRKYEEQASRFTMEQLKKSICALSRADLKIKSSGLDEWYVMEQEIIALIPPKPPSAKTTASRY